MENNNKTHSIRLLILLYTSFPPPLQSQFRLYNLPILLFLSLSYSFLSVAGWWKPYSYIDLLPLWESQIMFMCLVSNITFLDLGEP
jgi:hypothetical protein